MDKYQDFKVNVKRSEWDSFKKEFHKIVDCDYWKRRDDFISRINDTEYDDKDIVCIETPKIAYNDKTLHAVMWMWLKNSNSSLEIFNIVPLIGNHLECEEYNHILEQFRLSIIAPMSQNFHLQVVVSKPYLDMEGILGDEGFKLLQMFSAGANKSTGNTHPCDFARWCDFVFYVHREDISLSTTDLENWLMENGWWEEKASELALEYEYTLNVLERYEQDKH